jgi:sugar transferase (PEP-CTERM system associated)
MADMSLSRPITFWIHWRTLVEVLADFSFIVIVIVSAVRWIGAGLPVVINIVLMYALVVSLSMLPINAWLGLYQRVHYRTLNDSRARAVLSLHLAVPVAAAIITVLHLAEVSRDFLEVAAMIGLFGVLTNRVRMAHTLKRPVPRDRVLVYGVGERATMVKEALDRTVDQVEVVGYYPSTSEKVLKVPEEMVLHREGSLMDLAHRLNVDEIVVAVTERRGGAMPLRELLDCKLRGVRVYDLASYFEQTLGQIRLDALYAGWLIFGEGFSQPPLRTIVKRAFDMLFATALLIVAAPVMALAAVLIVVESGLPILYRQERVGLHGRLFNVVKFRSMRTDAEKDGTPRWAVAKDDRVTRVGRIIRKTRIDELPQLFSVLSGDMSLVGPRPERPYFVDQLTKQIPFYAVRHSVKPGVTGWAQVRYHYGASVDDAAQKLQYDLYYVKNHTLMLDLVILFETIEVVLTARGAQ